MVSGEVPDGGSLSLADLVDEYGEAIDFDFRRFLGVDLSDYLAGERPVREGLRRVLLLPPESATVAQMRANPAPSGSAASRRENAWRVLYGRSPEWDVLADLWDLSMATAQAQSGKRGKKTTYPRDANGGTRRRRRG